MNPVARNLLLLFSISLSLFACRKKDLPAAGQDNRPDDSGYIEYISEYTSGAISRKSVILVKLVRSVDLSNSAIAGEQNMVDPNILRIKPEINGKAVWEDSRSIRLEPESLLPSGKSYTASLNLAGLYKVPAELASFEWEFRTKEQNFELTFDKVIFTEEGGERMQTVTGQVETADWVESEAVEKILSARWERRNLPLNWQHEEEANLHHFTIEKIGRQSKTYTIEVAWDGSAIDVKKKGLQDVEIFGLDEFRFISYSLVQSPQLYINVQFSLAVDPKLDLSGIVRVEGDPSPRYLVENNSLHIYPSGKQSNTVQVIISKELKDNSGSALGAEVNFSITFTQEKPQVKWIRKTGGILPDPDNLILPFQAISLKAVDLTVVEVFEENIIQFLQVNANIKGNRELKRVGRPVLYKTVSLENAAKNLFEWNSFYLNLEDLIKLKPGSLYQVRINFRRSQSLYTCNQSDEGLIADELLKEDWNSPGETSESSYWDYWDDYYYDGDYWDKRNDPCSNAYYGQRRELSLNLLASSLGIIARGSETGNLRVYVSNILTTEPLAGVKINIYDYQQQELATGKTDSQGFVAFSLAAIPFALVASSGAERGYLRLDSTAALPLSGFDIGGTGSRKGIKGFLYGERGVWRPGDTIYLNFILEDKYQTLPRHHPVIFELRNPRGILASQQIKNDSTGDIYNFTVATAADAPTGNWQASVRVGGEVFYKSLKIETVKPNRLKINLDFGRQSLSVEDESITANLTVNWLHGAAGSNMKTQFELNLVPVRTTFAGYQEFVFDDPTRSQFSSREEIFSGKTDNEGKAEFHFVPGENQDAPGQLKAIFTGRVYEEGGDFSIDRVTLPYYPYRSFAGIKLPPGDKARGMLLTDTDHKVEIVTLSSSGKPLSRQGLDVSVYKLSWKWWWDKSDENTANYFGKNFKNRVATGLVNTKDGRGTYTLRINYPQWGRYLLRVEDPQSGHATGQIFYIDWPGWAGTAQREGMGSATMLSFYLDDTEYEVGESARITIPGAAPGRALLSLETGSRIVDSYWLETVAGKNEFDFKVTAAMSPNVYVHLTLLQPYAQVSNDLPIRLYGVYPAKVTDPATKLTPEVNVPGILAPEKEVVIKVKEKNGQSMAYTVAVVDEGLLDLTGFHTPDPWNYFYAREALGIKSWDVYDDVLGILKADLSHLLTIGGDGDELLPPKDQQANRFKPVVQFFGPYLLAKGATATHRFTMPRYIGAVKTMVVAAENGSYGRTDTSSFVRESLMVLGTMPRVLGPGEKIKLPVNIFVLDEKIKQVDVSVRTTGPLQLSGSNSSRLTFTKTGDKFIYFDLTTPGQIGLARVFIEATSGSEKATYEVELDVRPSNPMQTEVVAATIKPGESWKQQIKLLGLAGTNSQTLELSYIPPLNLEKRLNFLISYPHGCIEQTTSSVFPQLFLDKLLKLTDKAKAEIEINVKAGIDRLRKFQLGNGGFSYWQGDVNPADWASSYAGHFLVEARDLGYSLPQSMLSSWAAYQKEAANTWRDEDKNRPGELTQAYRLYTLALYGSPDLGAMNRLKEKTDLEFRAKWRLAAAYALAGKASIARDLVLNLPVEVTAYKATSATYGSALRDTAMILETLVYLEDLTTGIPLVRAMAGKLGSEEWYSTQTTAYTLLAIAKFSGRDGQAENISCEYQFGTEKGTLASTMTLAVQEFTAQAGSLTVTNKGGKPVFARFISRGIPLTGSELDQEKHIRMEVLYMTKDGRPVKDLSRMQQGTDLLITALITNSGVYGDLEELAFTHIVPPGWEIINPRLQETGDYGNYDQPEYLDVRDDRVLIYFDLKSAQTKRFGFMINAAYLGEYYLPGVSCEDMYNSGIASYKKGSRIAITR